MSKIDLDKAIWGGAEPRLKSVIVHSWEDELVEREVWNVSVFPTITEEKNFLHTCCEIGEQMLRSARNNLNDLFSTVYYNMATSGGNGTFCPACKDLFDQLEVEVVYISKKFDIPISEDVQKIIFPKKKKEGEA